MHYLGLDVHKRFSQVALMDARGEVLHRQRLSHQDPEGLKAFLASLPRPTEAALEATGPWPWLGDLLEEAGLSVHLASPSRVRLIAEARVKTDEVDAKTLAHLLRLNFLPEAYRPPKEVRDQRERLRYRVALVWTQTEVKNRVHALLSRHGVLFEGTDLFGKKGRGFLEDLSLPPLAQEVLRGHLRLLDGLKALIEEVTQEIRQHLREDPRGELLRTLPGVAELTANLLLWEIGDIHRFPSERKFSAYCGLVPSVRQSGGHRVLGPLTRQGNPYLRWALIEASHRAIRVDPGLLAFHRRITQKKGKKTAAAAVAHKLAISVYHVLKRGEPYRPMKTRPYRLGKPVPPLAP